MIPSIWTEPVVTRFRQLLAEGAPYSDCASLLSKEFGIMLTRSACIGRAKRTNTAPSRRKIRMPAKPPPEKFFRPRKPPQRVVDLQARGTVTIMELLPNDCRWPSGDRSPFMFCGAPQIEGCSYCEAHALMGFTKR